MRGTECKTGYREESSESEQSETVRVRDTRIRNSEKRLE